MNPDTQTWSLEWFDRCVESFAEVDAPRSLALAALGASAILAVSPRHHRAVEMLEKAGSLLSTLLDRERRQDGKNLYLLMSPDLNQWEDDGTLLMEPAFPWEYIQIGNCGSPIETAAGWLLLTYGVGPMREYALGCVLLDRADPTKVIGRLREPVLTAADADLRLRCPA